MVCSYCNNPIPENETICPHCGAPAPQQPQQPQQPQPPVYQPPYQQTAQPKPSVGFVDAIKLFFANFTNFSGRSRRSEYWWATLFTGLVNGVVSSIPVLGAIISLALCIPGIALSIRRLHDIGKSGWYLLLAFIPIANFYLIYLMCQDSQGPNMYGPSPKY